MLKLLLNLTYKLLLTKSERHIFGLFYKMSSSEYFSTNASVPFGQTVRLPFLSETRVSNEAWVLANKGYSADGQLRVRIVDQLGTGLSDWSDINSSYTERVKMFNVNIPSGSPFPPVLQLEVQNTATQGGDAHVFGVRIYYY
jgi:hypothetical protein